VIVTCVPGTPTAGVTVEIVAVPTVRGTVFDDIPFCCTWAVPDWEPVEIVATIRLLLLRMRLDLNERQLRVQNHAFAGVRAKRCRFGV